jgi:serine/threonine protein kinase
MQLVQGGELFDRIVERKSYNEAEARDLVSCHPLLPQAGHAPDALHARFTFLCRSFQIRICLEAIHYMHSMCIVHRDLKPENLLMLSPHNDYQIVVSDFGLARDVSESDCRDMVGSPYYVAPEVLKMCPHGMAVDIWALGVICFILLGGYPPFHDDNQKKLYQKIKSGKFEFHSTSWSIISDEAKMLISRMLTVDPAERISAKDALRHPWLLGRRRKDLEHHNLDRNLSQLVSFNARRKLRAAIRSVVFAKRMEVLSVDTDDENSSVSSRKSSKVLVSHPSEG